MSSAWSTPKHYRWMKCSWQAWRSWSTRTYPATKHASSFEAAEQTKEVPLDPAAPKVKALRVSSTLDPK
jgi:hypothetical protein